MTKKFNLSDFTLEAVTLELKYHRAPLLWDKAGTVMSALLEEFPDAEAGEISPLPLSLPIPKPNALSPDILEEHGKLQEWMFGDEDSGSSIA